jgi:prolyl-tRNA editing enzyme YbaK/EbsC (Cys-tRNA(Pro) deacylase)
MASEIDVQVLLERISALEARISSAEEDPRICTARVKRNLEEKRVFTACFRTVPTHYYDLSLLERANLLGCSVQHLCKSIIFQNTLCPHNNCDGIANSKFFCVIVQYSEKINGEKLRDFIHKLSSPESRISKNKIHLRLADENDSRALSGFVHNAVSPFGMLAKIPTIVCNSCVQLSPKLVWLGGGAVDIKVCISILDLLRATEAVVADISEPRDLCNLPAGDLDER